MVKTAIGIKEDVSEEDIKKLVLARLAILSSDTAFSIGAEGSFTRDELIESVERGDRVGKKFEEIQIEWLRSLKDGVI